MKGVQLCLLRNGGRGWRLVLRCVTGEGEGLIKAKLALLKRVNDTILLSYTVFL